MLGSFPLNQLEQTPEICLMLSFFYFLFFLGYRGIVHSPSADEGTERTWFEPEAMIHNDWTKCNNNIKQISGVCSSWSRGKDPSMTLAAFQSLWCHNGTLASVTSPSGDVDGRLELQLHLSATCPVLLF